MNTDHERVEKFLKGVEPPEYESEEHRRQLRGQILSRLETRRAGKGMGVRWRTAALLAGLLCAGAVATESILQARHYNFEGTDKDGQDTFSYEAENGRGSGLVSIHKRGHWWQMNSARIEQERKFLEEIDALRRRNARQLVGVGDTVVNGKFLARGFQFEYVLADGHKTRMGESGDEAATNASPAQKEQEQKQIDELRKRGEREICNIIDTEFEGQTQRTLGCRYVLSDGRGVNVDEADPELPAPAKILTTGQQQELTRLVQLNKGELLATVRDRVFGKTFTFKRYGFKLSDGTVVTWSRGEPEGPKSRLTSADWKELKKLIAAHKGQTTGGYNEEVKGKMFHFTSTKYVLSDGTEVIQSHGEPEPVVAQPTPRRGGVIITGGSTTNSEEK